MLEIPAHKLKTLARALIYGFVNPERTLRQAYSAGSLPLLLESRKNLFVMATQLCQHRHPRAAQSILERTIDGLRRLGQPFTEEKGLLDLIVWLRAAEAGDLPKWKVSGRPHVIDLPIFGEWYIERANQRFLPSLLSPGNVPALAKHGTVILAIHTRKHEIEKIERLSSIQKLKQFVKVEYFPWEDSVARLLEPSDLFSSSLLGRFLLSAARHKMLLAARQHGADFSPGAADIIFSKNFLSECKDLLIQGKVAAIDTCPRVVDSKLALSLKPDEEGVLAIEAEALYRAELLAYHPHFWASFMRQTPSTISVDPVLFNISSDQGFSMFAFQYFVSAVNGAKIPQDLTFDFHTPDGRLTSDLVAGRDFSELSVNRALPSKRLCLQVDSYVGESKFGSQYPVTPEEAVRTGLKWVSKPHDIEYFKTMISTPMTYHHPSDLEANDYPKDSLTQQELMERLEKAFAVETPKVMERLQTYSILANRIAWDDRLSLRRLLRRSKGSREIKLDPSAPGLANSQTVSPHSGPTLSG